MLRFKISIPGNFGYDSAQNITSKSNWYSSLGYLFNLMLYSRNVKIVVSISDVAEPELELLPDNFLCRPIATTDYAFDSTMYTKINQKYGELKYEP